MTEHRQVMPAWWLLIPALLLIFWLGAYNLNTDTAGVDELTSMYHIGVVQGRHHSVEHILYSLNRYSAPHVPVYFWGLALWRHLAGDDPAALRVLSVFFGLLATAFTYRLGRDLVSARVGVCAAALAGSSQLYVYYMHEMRMYTLMTLLGVSVLWLYLRIIRRQRPPHPLEWLGLLLGTIAAVYTHSFTLFILVSIGLYHLLLAPKNRLWWQVALVMSAGVLTLLPYAGILAQGSERMEGNPGLQNNRQSTVEALVALAQHFSSSQPALFAAGGLLALLGLASRRRGAGVIFFFTVSILGLLLAVNLFYTLFFIQRWRYMLILWPLVGLVMALGIDELGRRTRPVLALALLGLWLVPNMVMGLQPTAQAQRELPLIRLADALDGLVQPGDRLIGFTTEAMIYPYGNIADLYLAELNDAGVRYSIAGRNASPAGFITHEETLEDILAYPQLWVVFRPGFATRIFPTYIEAIEERYTLCESHQPEPAVRLDRYVRQGNPCQAD